LLLSTVSSDDQRSESGHTVCSYGGSSNTAPSLGR
jgi:hypothetical protein